MTRPIKSAREKRDTIGKILDAACEEFAEYGLAGARVDRLAHRAGVNKAMIYYHFGSKEKLYQAVINEHFNRIRQIADIGDFTGDDIETVFLGFTEGLHSVFVGREKFIPVFLREMASGGEYFTQGMARVIDELGLTRRLKKIIDEGKRQGHFRDVDTRQAIASFIGMNMMYQLTAPVFNAVWEIKDEKIFRKHRPRAVVDLFLNGIRAE